MSRLKYTPAEAQKYLTLLEATVSFLVETAAGFDEAELRWSPSERDWSMIEVLAHLRACAELWTYSIYAMLAEKQPSLPLLDERKWARTRRYTEATFAENYQVFALERSALLNVLRKLPEESWSRQCTIGERSHTVFSQTRRMALHEVEHQQQIQALVTGLSKRSES